MLPWWPWYGWPLVIAAAFVALCYALWYRAVRRLGRLREWHHEHFAPPLLLLAWLAFARGWVVAGYLCVAAAVWVASDDALQHQEQLTNPTHRSFLHRLAHRLRLI